MTLNWDQEQRLTVHALKKVVTATTKKGVVELKAELHIFILQEMNSIEIFHGEKKLSILCSLADIFAKTNSKLFLQGKFDILISKWGRICFSKDINVMERAFWKHI